MRVKSHCKKQLLNFKRIKKGSKGKKDKTFHPFLRTNFFFTETKRNCSTRFKKGSTTTLINLLVELEAA